jgi:ABC-type sugar transport system permease subunit
MFEAQGGLFNLILGALGLPAVPWLEHIWWARVALCILVIWAWLGQNMVYMLAGLQTISSELTEAAKIDGANSTQTLFHITIPLLRPVILFATILSTMGSFGLFAETMTLTWGGRPMRATLTTIVYLYNVAFGDYRFGRASALSYIYFALIFVLSILQFRRFGRDT